MPAPCLLDCDPGHDDAIALLLAAAHPALDLRAVSTVAGNGEIDRVTHNALAICTLAGIRDRHDLSWIDLPIFGEDGAPMHERGVVTSEPGMYFIGLPFQFAAGSDVLPGVGRDARYVVKQLLRRTAAARAPQVTAAA